MKRVSITMLVILVFSSRSGRLQSGSHPGCRPSQGSRSQSTRCRNRPTASPAAAASQPRRLNRRPRDLSRLSSGSTTAAARSTA